MKKTLLKSLTCFMLTLSIIAGTVATAFADELIKNCYTADNAELLDEYINAYGWDKDKMLAKNWTDNGKEYKRQIGGQREYLADCFKGTDDFLMSEPEFDKDNKIILEGNKEKTIAFLEKHNIPLDSINSGTMVYGSGGQGIVAVALGEVGRTDSVEQPPKSNRVKYNRWFYGRDERADWCVIFIMWCAYQAGCSDVFPHTANTGVLGRGMADMGYKSFRIKTTTPFGGTAYTPVPGDIMLYSRNGTASGSTHVGLVVAVDSESITTVEGNTTGWGQVPGEGVAKVRYDINRLNSYGPAANALIYHVNYPLSSMEDGSDLTTYIKGTLGLSDAGLCGVLASMVEESGGDATKENHETGAYGLFQWSGSRLDAFNSWCMENGFAFDTATAQIKYLAYDLQTNNSHIWNGIRSVSNDRNGAYNAASTFAYYFDSVKSSPGKAIQRAKLARDVYWPRYENKG
jgi:hypothetical protein